MICLNCRAGADAEVASRYFTREKEIKDCVGKAKTYHSKCDGPSCMCQHRVGMKNVIR